MLALEINEVDARQIADYAAAQNISVSEFMRRSAMEKMERDIANKLKDPFYSEQNMERLRKNAAAVKAGRYSLHNIDEVK